MRKEQHGGGLGINERKASLRLLSYLVWKYLFVAAFMVLTPLFSSLLFRADVHPKRIELGFIFLAAGLLLLNITIVGIGNIIQRTNRDVILLSRQLGRIYLSALKSSALNPKLESSSPHE